MKRFFIPLAVETGGLSPLDFSVASRDRYLHVASQGCFDLVVIGGGITGAGVLLDAVTRGLSALLVEKHDFGSGTSSRSSRLIHGGLRYLEQFDFGVVASSLRERSTLLRIAPHLVWSAPFVIPIFRDSFFYRKRHLVRAGLAIYDALGASVFSCRHRHLDNFELSGLIPGIDSSAYEGGIVYWDAINDDVRTCMAVLQTAVSFGALALNYCEAVRAEQTRSTVQVLVRDHLTKREVVVTARAIVNATGVFADEVSSRLGFGIHLPLVPARGAHIILRRSAYPGKAAVLLPVEMDQRFIFVIPTASKVIVGTTDTPHNGPLYDPSPTESEIRYIAEAYRHWSSASLEPGFVTGAYAGLRPLVSKSSLLVGGSRNRRNDSFGSSRNTPPTTSDISRRHVFAVGRNRSLTVTGGKFTAYRKMAQEAVDIVGEQILGQSLPPSKTANIPLWGACSFEWFIRNARSDKFYLGQSVPLRALRWLWRRYGSEGLRVMRYNAQVNAQPEEALDAGATWCFKGQILYAIRHESAARIEDVLFRRTRLGSDDLITALALAPYASEIGLAYLPGEHRKGWAVQEINNLSERLNTMLKILDRAVR